LNATGHVNGPGLLIPAALFYGAEVFLVFDFPESYCSDPQHPRFKHPSNNSNDLRCFHPTVLLILDDLRVGIVISHDLSLGIRSLLWFSFPPLLNSAFVFAVSFP